MVESALAMTRRDTAKPFLILAQQFLLTSSAVMHEMIASENQWVVVSESPVDDDEYNLRTRWSDFNTMLPALFLFFHGSELLCKGALQLVGRQVPATHDLPSILASIQEHHGLDAMGKILSKYLALGPDTPEFLAQYMSSLGKDTSFTTLYESLRYPSSRMKVAFDHSWLRHNSNLVLHDLRVMESDVHAVLSICVRQSKLSSE
jgi:hypothetical protein